MDDFQLGSNSLILNKKVVGLRQSPYTLPMHRGSRFNCCVSLWHLSHTVKGQKTPQSTRRCCGAALTGTGGKLVTSHARKLTPVPVCQACLLPRLPALFSLQKQGNSSIPQALYCPKLIAETNSGYGPNYFVHHWFKSMLHSSVSQSPGCVHAACSGRSAFRPCVPKVCCMQTVCLGKTNEKHNLKVIWNVYVGPSGWIKVGPWKAGKECAVQ